MGIIIKLVLFIHEFLKNEFVNDVDFGDLYQQQRNNIMRMNGYNVKKWESISKEGLSMTLSEAMVMYFYS
jgi:hypothetical protein